MKLGNRFTFLLILMIAFNFQAISDDKIISTPLINLEKIKPSFEK